MKVTMFMPPAWNKKCIIKSVQSGNMVAKHMAVLRYKWILVLLSAITYNTAFAQQKTDTLIKKLDSLHSKADSTGQVNVIKQEAYNEKTKIDVPTYFVLVASDLKQQLTKPFHMHGKDWKNLGIYAVVVGGIAFADEPIQKFAVDLRDHNPGMLKFSRFVTNTGGPYEVITLGLLGGYGLIFKKEKIETTALLASQAYITSGVLHVIIKGISGRQRPFTYNPNRVEADPIFHGPFHKPFRDINGRRIGSSFPSGHTAGAFAAATVFAMEYRDRPLVKIIALTSATLIGLSRITENKHWATDVLTGAALGYLSGRQVVNNYHRYATLKNAKAKKGSVSFQLNYNFGTIQPGVVYTFR
jgi:membrane-associated phospholipid phosphatase